MNVIEPISFPTAPVLEGVSTNTQTEVRQIKQRNWGLTARVDPTVTFEEYQYWAEIERAEEREANRLYHESRGPTTFLSVIKGRFSKGYIIEDKKKAESERRAKAIALLEEPRRLSRVSQTEGADTEKRPDEKAIESPIYADTDTHVTEEEWRTAARALRTASWGTVFFLITTDILGWSSAPYVFASVGYGPGCALYFVFGVFAGLSGWILWKLFLGLDSTRFPILSFGDAFYRIYGAYARHFINVLQSIMQFLTVAVLVLGNGSTLAEIAKERICYIVCFLIVMILGMISGSMRSLQRLGWLCNASVWMNVASFLIIIVACVKNPPDTAPVIAGGFITPGPKKTFAGPPPVQYQQQSNKELSAQLNGLDSLVYAWAGCLLFYAFLAEMRHPWDFWKGLLCAEVFITIVYMFFGAFVYHFYAQFSYSSIGLVVQPYSLQTVGNVLGLLTGLIACFLYFNIGMKTVYLEVFQEILHFPPIQTKKGKLMWYLLGPFYWIVAFIFAASVPNLSGIVNFVGGLFAVNFTYSFPGMLLVGYNCQVGAALPGEGFDPFTGLTTRHDSGMKRWIRGYKKYLVVNTLIVLYVLAGLCTSALGTYASILGLIEIFGPGGTIATSWGCAVPV